MVTSAPHASAKLATILAANNAAAATAANRSQSACPAPSIIVTEPSRDKHPHAATNHAHVQGQAHLSMTRLRQPLHFSLPLSSPTEAPTASPERLASHSSSPNLPTLSTLSPNLGQPGSGSAPGTQSRPKLSRMPSPDFNAAKASSTVRSMSGYVSFRDVEGLGCPFLDDEEFDGQSSNSDGTGGSQSQSVAWFPTWLPFGTGPGRR